MIPWSKSNNQNQNSSNDENNPDENVDDIFDKNEKIPESPLFIDVEDIVQVDEIARTTANDPVHFFYLLHITN